MEMEVRRVKYWAQGHLIIKGRDLILTLEPVFLASTPASLAKSSFGEKWYYTGFNYIFF